MAWTSYQLALSIVLVVTGSINTLTTKWADRMEAKGRDGEIRYFNHPFVQSLAMFLGEMLCLLTYKILYFYYMKKDNSQDERNLVKGNRNFRVSIFFLPAMCDLIGTSITYIGLTMTNASSFQMLRGALIIFVVLLSVGFLNRQVNSREWTGIFTIILGLVIVGLSDFYISKEEKNLNSVITGDLLIVLGQILTATQIVLEEYFVAGQDVPPLQAVGWEGTKYFLTDGKVRSGDSFFYLVLSIALLSVAAKLYVCTFGFIVLGFLQIPLRYLHVGRPFSTNPDGALEDLGDAIVQMQNNHLLILCIIGTILSIAFFNFAGISVTKEISATTRTVLDSVRTLVIWLMTLALGWEKFSFLQVIGFTLLVIGMFVYNDIFITRGIRTITNWYTSRPMTNIPHESLVNQAADETNP